MARDIGLWLALAAITALWSAAALSAGSVPLVPLFLCVLALACASNGGVRERVMRKLAWAFSGPALRSVLIIGGALMLIQLLPLEMALLLAGDVLAYVEILAAVSLVAANVRLRPWVAAARQGVVRAVAVLARPRSRAFRAPRPARRPAPSRDDDDRGWAFA